MLAQRLSSSLGLVGVDLGTRAIKLLQLREQAGSLQVLGAAMVDPDEPAGGDGPDLKARFRAAFTSGRFTGRKCVVSLPRNDLRLQSIRLPKMPDDELRQAAAWEASQRFGLEREATEVDFVRTGACVQSGENREEVLILALSHAVIHDRLAPLLAAGLRPVALDTGFGALARLFGRRARRHDDADVRAVVEVGAAGSTVMILRGDQIALCKPIAIGGDRFSRAVAEHLQIDLRAAGELRAGRIASALGSAEEPDQATDRAVYEAVRPLMGDLVKEVMLCQRYYGVTFRGHPPKEIILTGGDGLEPSLDAMVTQACKIPVVFDDERASLERMARPDRGDARLQSPAARWAVVAGLSLRGVGARRRKEAA